jgi:hypothetical protein
MSSELVAHFLRAVPIDQVMAHLAQISAHDRYQASRGIEEAASLVADAACGIGLADVSIERFPADGTTRWWSFRAPLSWTPSVARLEVWVGECRLLEIDHARQPFSIAAYSATTPPGGVMARLLNIGSSPQTANVAGAIAVIGQPEFARRDLVPELTRGGAIGFVTDGAFRSGSLDLEIRRRIELDPGTSLFAFSLTPRELRLVQTWAHEGAAARVIVDVDRTATMPVVTGVLPGQSSEKEIWLTAHLCHPRPGANDNASGVAALLGIAAAQVASRAGHACYRSQRAIRFFWGPEFLGMAAMIQQRMGLLGRVNLPAAVINLDMVGEDQSLCGGPFLIERNPDCYPALISPIAEDVVRQVFAQTDKHPGTWRYAPFTGFSDHSLFADPNIGCAAVQLCHSPDRFNHSEADSLDKVSAVEMLRSTVAGATLAQILASDDALPASVVDRIVRDWCARELSDAERVALRYERLAGGAWGRRLVRYIEQGNAAMLALLGGEVTGRSNDLEDRLACSPDDPVLMGSWSGPFNARAMLAELPGGTRSAVSSLIRSDKNNIALLLNFAIRADGRRNQSEIVDETAFAFRRPIDDVIAKQLLGALIESGWAMEVPRWQQ